MYTFSPNTKAKSSEVNQNFTDLSNGTGDVDANKLALTRAEAFSDFVASGLVWSQVSGLNGAMTTGIAYVTDASGLCLRLSVSAITSKAFTASKDTYVDLGSDGVVYYTEVANGATEPALSANRIRLAKVIANGSAITGIVQSGTTDISTVYPKSPVAPYDWYEEIGRTTLKATSSSMSVTFPKKKYLKIIIAVIASGGVIDSAIIFNNDNGNNYATKYTANFGAAVDSLSATSIPIESGQTDNGQMSTTIIEIVNVKAQEKNISYRNLSQDATGAATPVVTINGVGKWANTSALITSIQLVGANIGKGSEIVVLGHD